MDAATWGFQALSVRLEPKVGESFEPATEDIKQLYEFVGRKLATIDSNQAMIYTRNSVREAAVLMQTGDGMGSKLWQMKSVSFGNQTKGVPISAPKAFKAITSIQKENLKIGRPVNVVVLINENDTRTKDLFFRLHEFDMPSRQRPYPGQFLALLNEQTKRDHESLPLLAWAHPTVRVGHWKEVNPEITGRKLFDPFEL